ncbi:MAG: hypothetical protein IJP28_02180 [Erysipelotrichales bacterium]|nr:hypothetical protein [Erysipelotrichales bacterium]
METYPEFLERIYAFEKKELFLGNDYFSVHHALHQKVDQNNTFRPFYGDTIVFDLDELTKEKITKITDQLYNTVPHCFSERLSPNTYHMTLHDLSNSPNIQDIATEVFQNELQVLEKSKEVETMKIQMRSTCIFNMMNTSLVLGLYPVNEEEYQKLMKLYAIYNSVKTLPYPLTPHITLAYYNIHGFDSNAARILEHIVNSLNQTDIEIELHTSQLYYQKFVSMNDYIPICTLDTAKK